MKKYKNINIITMLILLVMIMPIKAFAAEAISNININFTVPTLNGPYEAITLDNLEVTNSSSTSLKSAVTTFNVSCTTSNAAGGIVGCTDYNNPGVYSFSIDIGLNTGIAYFQGSGSNYTGALTINGSGSSYSAASSSSLKIYLDYDLRENKDIADLEFYYYPTVGQVVSAFNLISLNENISSLGMHSKYVEGSGWEEIFGGTITYTAGTKYKIYFAEVSSNKYIFEAENKTATTTANIYDVVINFNNEQINAKYNDSYKTLSFEYEFEASKETLNVTYDNKGHGTAPANTTVTPGDKTTKPSDLTADGYTFGGWYIDSECTKAYDFNKKVFKDITLYAKWTAITENPQTSDGIISSVIVGIISIITLVSCGLYIKKKKKLN